MLSSLNEVSLLTCYQWKLGLQMLGDHNIPLHQTMLYRHPSRPSFDVGALEERGRIGPQGQIMIWSWKTSEPVPGWVRIQTY